MNLTTNLDRERYYWVAPELAPSDDATLTITVTANPRSGQATLRMQIGSAMRSARIKGGPTGRAGSILDLELGSLAAGETRTISARISPGRITRPGRRRVAVVQVVEDNEVLASTTVWARIERQLPGARGSAGSTTPRR